MINYRKEIDGLRAIAVLPVVLSHAGFALFSGGFVGVDVFFVISGYLITTIILAEKQAGVFTLAGFYERRARRILPALFLVMLACLPLAWIWMLPGEFKSFSLSLVAVAAFSSNILFLGETGYFDTASELKPLLHTWSLAVEEQYYLFFPLFMLLAWRFGKSWMIGVLAVAAMISLTLAQWGALNHPAHAFYLLPTRGWELLIGAFIAFYLFTQYGDKERTAETANLLNHSASLFGLFLILYAVFAFDKNTPFPSIYALIPTIGAALIILFTTEQTLVGKLLGSKWFVGTGLISYSIYLWHQPMFAFSRLRSLAQPSAYFMLLLVVSTIVVAYFSWKYVEKPFRDKRRIHLKAALVSAILMSALMFIFGGLGYFSNGFEFRDIGNHRNLDQRVRVNYGLSATCDEKFTLSKDCRTSDLPEILVWGDSYAMHLVRGILASKKNVKLIQMTKTACGPFYNLAPLPKVEYQMYTRKWSEECLEFNDQVMNWIVNNSSVKYAVLASPFSAYTSANWDYLTADGVVKSDQKVALSYLMQTLELLSQRGIKPVVFGPPPQGKNDVGQCLVKSTLLELDSNQCDFSLDASVETEVNKFLAEVSKKYQVVWLEDEICRNGVCKAFDENVFIYRDKGHLSLEGSEFLGRKMKFYESITQ